MADASKASSLHLLMADSHALFRAGMRYLLGELCGATGIVEVASAVQARAAAAGARFDLALIDPEIWVGGISEAVGDLHGLAEDLPIIVISAVDDPRAARHALGEGAVGYVPKDSPPQIMLSALNLVLAGGIYLPPRLLELLPAEEADDTFAERTPREPLSGRQRAILAQLAKGAPNKEIARALKLSEGAVKAHIAGLLRLLNARNRTEAIIRAAERGWIASGPNEAVRPGPLERR